MEISIEENVINFEYKLLQFLNTNLGDIFG